MMQAQIHHHYKQILDKALSFDLDDKLMLNKLTSGKWQINHKGNIRYCQGWDILFPKTLFDTWEEAFQAYEEYKQKRATFGSKVIAPRIQRLKYTRYYVIIGVADDGTPCFNQFVHEDTLSEMTNGNNPRQMKHFLMPVPEYDSLNVKDVEPYESNHYEEFGEVI